MKQSSPLRGAKAATLWKIVPFAAAFVVVCAGCSKASDKPPTANEAAAFKGGAPTAQDRIDMKKEVDDAAAYRKAHPNEFPDDTTLHPPAAPAAPK